MKRDARIGLAVVLVLGLSVTMLIGRAIYKRGGSAAEGDGEQFATETTTDANKLGDPPTANVSQPQNPAVNLLNPDAQRLIDAESRQIERPAPVAGTTTPTTPVRRNEHGDPITSDLDHESPGTGRPVSPRGEFYAYTVVNGDSPWTISNKVFGDGKYTQKIVDANELNTKKMKTGMVLKIPAIANKPMQVKLQPFVEPGARTAQHDATGGKQVAAEKHTAAPTGSKSTYKVESGDTLAVIAKKHYGSNGPKTIQLIVAANHGLDPAKLKVGQEISLPAVK